MIDLILISARQSLKKPKEIRRSDDGTIVSAEESKKRY
jgi:hypothetical protein